MNIVLRLGIFGSKKNNAILFVLEKPFEGAESLAPHLQKYFAFEVLRKNNIYFDQIAIIDADTMIKWDCPDFFEISKNSFCAVLDDELPKWVNASLATYKFLFPETTINWWEYFNSGVMILNKSHARLLSEFVAFVNSKEEELSALHSNPALRAGFDQTLFNYFIKEKNVKTVYLPKIFNFYHLLRKNMLEKKEFIDCAYIWHFNGIEHSKRKNYMQETWDIIKKNYQ